MASSSSTAGSGRGPSNSDRMAKATVADQISQAVLSTSNLLHLMRQSSPSQAHLIKLPKNLLAKTSTIKNTGQVCDARQQFWLEDRLNFAKPCHPDIVVAVFKAGAGADASDHFILGCTHGKWTT